VYDYSYTTKNGPIHNLQEPKRSLQLSNRYANWYESQLAKRTTDEDVSTGSNFGDTRISPRSRLSTTSTIRTDDEGTPLYFTASTPFVLPSNLNPKNGSLASNTRSFYSLPSFQSSPDTESKSSLTKNAFDIKNISSRTKTHTPFQLNLSPRGKPLWSEITTNNAQTNAQNYVKANQAPDRTNYKREEPPPPSRPPSIPPHFPPSRTSRSASFNRPYSLRQAKLRSASTSTACASLDVIGASSRKELGFSDSGNDWVLPSSPEEAYWLSSSQEEVSIQRIIYLLKDSNIVIISADLFYYKYFSMVSLYLHTHTIL